MTCSELEPCKQQIKHKTSFFLLQTRFQQHFGGPYLELGHLIYQQLFGHVTTSVSMEMFVAAATRLERVCTRGSSEEKESFVFSVFAEGAEQLNEKSECKKNTVL